MCYWCIIACYTLLGKATLCRIWVCLSPFDEVVTHLNTVGQSSTSSVPILKWRVRWLSLSISSCWPVVAMYQWYQIMICLLKFDFFAFTGVTMQVAPYHPSAWFISLDAFDIWQLLIVVLSQNSAEFGVTIAAIPIVLFLLILCGVAVQREIKWQVVCTSAYLAVLLYSRLMSISLVMMLAALSYCELRAFVINIHSYWIFFSHDSL